MITRAPPIWNPMMFITKPSCNSNVLSPWIIHQKEEVKWNWKFDFFYIVSWEKRKSCCQAASTKKTSCNELNYKATIVLKLIGPCSVM
jgi:hypothetical protein